MPVEELLSAVGDTGRYHWIILSLFSTTWLSVVFNNVIMTFYGYAPPLQSFHCSDEASTAQPPQPNQVGGGLNVTAFTVSNLTDDAAQTTHSSYCNTTSTNSTYWPAVTDATSIVIEWQLHGDRKWMVNLATSMYFAGVMLGGLVMGSLADVVGRKKVLLACLVAPVPLGVAVYFVPWYEGFVALRFCIGIFVQGLSGVGFVNCVEFFSAKHKLRVILGFEATWVFGMMLLSLMAFLLPDWRQLQFAVSLLPALTLVYAWWLPESPRWLTVRKRHAELLHIFERATRINKVTVDTQLLQKESVQLRSSNATTKTKRHFTIVDMIRTPVVRRRALSMFYIWFSVSTGYYALTFGMPPILPNRFLNFFVMACCELVGLAINGYALSRVGRKIPLLASMTSSGVICATSGVLASLLESSSTLTNVTTSMALIGRTLVTVSYQTLFLWTSELFPTVIRSLAVGACGFWMRTGSLVAPQLLLLGYYSWQQLPIIVIGVMCLVGGGLTLLLSETKNSVLPDSIEEIEGFQASNAIKAERRPADDSSHL